MLATVPQFTAQTMIDTWHRLGPIQIATIVLKTDEDWQFDPFKEDLEFKKFYHGDWYYEGFVKKGTKLKHGIGRMTNKKYG